MHCSLCFLALFYWIKFCSCFRQVFFIWKSKKWSLVALDSNHWKGICLGELSIGRFNWVQMFKCIISHSSTKSMVPPLHKFTIRKLDLFFTFFGKLNSLDITVYLLNCQYFGRMEKKLSARKVGLHFANFSQFELKRYAMKGKSKGNFQEKFFEVIFIVHWSGPTHRFLLQVLG